MSTPNVVGLDLSIAATGICDWRGKTSTVAGKPQLGDERLERIMDAIEAACADDGSIDVDLVVIEDLAIHGPGGGMAAAQVMGAAKYFIRYNFCGTVPYVLVSPSSLKKFATGKGNCGKPEMAIAAYKRAGLEFADDNQCDAWWLRAAGLDALGHPLFPMPQAQRDALAKVAWPDLTLTERTT